MSFILNSKIKNFVIAFILSILILPVGFSTPASATITVNNGVSTINSSSDYENIANGDLPNTSMDEISNKIEGKTYEVVYLMQSFAKPFCYIIFIACAIIAVFGAISKTAYLTKGLIGFFICGIVYTAILYAPEIVYFFSNWVVD